MRDGVCLVRAQGDVDVDSAAQLEAVLGAALSDGPAQVILDLEGVSFLDSSGLRVIVEAQRKAAADDATLVIDGMSAAVERVLEITDLLQSLTRGTEPPASSST